MEVYLQSNRVQEKIMKFTELDKNSIEKLMLEGLEQRVKKELKEQIMEHSVKKLEELIDEKLDALVFESIKSMRDVLEMEDIFDVKVRVDKKALNSESKY
jgi:uncharacterized membrane protein YheB (UPF0754 family)